MARHELEREDLLRDARALVHRAETRVETSDGSRTVFFGFHRTGAASFYFDQDPVYHLNSRGQLRRAFVNGELIKAQQGDLLASRRHRTTGEVQLLTRTLAPADQQNLLAAVHVELSRLLVLIDRGNLVLVGQIPDDADVVSQAAEWLRGVLVRPLVAADRPHVD